MRVSEVNFEKNKLEPEPPDSQMKRVVSYLHKGGDR